MCVCVSVVLRRLRICVCMCVRVLIGSCWWCLDVGGVSVGGRALSKND